MLAETTTIEVSANKGLNKQIATIGAFFFIFGFITWVNGTLIPYLRIACELEEWQAYLVTFAFYISYTVMAIPSSKLLEYTGMVKGMRVGLMVMAFGCALFIPAALMRFYPLFLLGLFIVGTGTTLLQTAVNPYITLLGPPEKAAQRISMMGICNKFAGVLAPLILGAVILNNSDGLIRELEQMTTAQRNVRLDNLAHAVILPYIVIALILMLIAFLIRFAHLPEISSSAVTFTTADSPKLSARQRINFLLGFIATFSTVGLEVIAGDTIGNYGIYHGLSLDVAKSLTSYTLASTMAGYIFGVYAIPRFIPQEKAYLYSAWFGVLISLLVIFVPGATSIAFVALLGLANALLWPAIWPQALRGLSGKMLNRGSAILIMGIAGGAIMPLVYGALARYTNNQYAYLILIPCYFFNVYYSRRGKRQAETLPENHVI
ncbi:sugar MFS transporter [Pedobacter hartonius]|uniref:Glucose/galactose transporter n=1 Tax=Pedobacter hartonius TaxID=425514 RepID=A0A1H4DS87_9SPHI|nr:sugar MFS transporter [Pedobacter hartonius]SEA75497.1 glucose/galactose transporter [Pedobacter hartonius]